MAKAAESPNEAVNEEPQGTEKPEMDSKYRMIIIAAQRSKQIQRGARPRVEMDTQRHKPTRVALEEVARGLVNFTLTDGD
ncbi:MAG TPA: DNA-directed RNA polymerase subunit omega [Pyrinomonadaceae bacterium]|jgi:DNA-directed RNA polymerase subunit omega|nr:DNA-directed RNA polymerase subunit omega [Pyrinomonadaceae bacterium]